MTARWPKRQSPAWIAAEDRGWDPHPDDALPAPAHVQLDDDWQTAIDDARARNERKRAQERNETA